MSDGVVFIDGYQITDDGVAYLTNISSIRGLTLLATPITESGCQTIAAKMKLNYVDLTDCPKVTANGLAMLAGAETLKELMSLVPRGCGVRQPHAAFCDKIRAHR